MATKSLYVGNLPYSITESQLLALFSAYGATSARVIEGRGFGFVDVDEDKMQAAIDDKHDSDYEGRALVVNEARPRDDRHSGGRSERGGFGGRRGGGGRSGGGGGRSGGRKRGW
jgi:RNA recognition motif-containing protein